MNFINLFANSFALWDLRLFNWLKGNMLRKAIDSILKKSDQDELNKGKLKPSHYFSNMVLCMFCCLWIINWLADVRWITVYRVIFVMFALLHNLQTVSPCLKFVQTQLYWKRENLRKLTQLLICYWQGERVNISLYTV